MSLSVQHLNDIDNLDGLPWFINIPQMMIHNDFGYTFTILNKNHQVSTWHSRSWLDTSKYWGNSCQH